MPLPSQTYITALIKIKGRPGVSREAIADALLSLSDRVKSGETSGKVFGISDTNETVEIGTFQVSKL